MNRYEQLADSFLQDMFENTGDISKENKKKWEHKKSTVEDNFRDVTITKGAPSSAKYNTDVDIDKIIIHEERMVVIEHTFIRRKNED